MLKKTEIRTEFERRRKERWKRLEMTAAEAAALIALRARADIGQAFDETGEMLPVHRWPEELRLAVKSVRGEHVTLHDGLKACEVVLQMHGTLKHAVDVRHFDHVAYLASKSEGR